MTERAHAAMLTDSQIQKVRKDIERSLGEIFSPMDITGIVLKPDEDFDGDPILRVYVNYKGEIPDKGGTRAAAIDKIRDILEGKKDLSFPVMTFIKEKNIKKRGRIL